MLVSFQIFDFDGDNKISESELSQMLEATLAENDLWLTPEEQTALVRSTFEVVQNFIAPDFIFLM